MENLCITIETTLPIIESNFESVKRDLIDKLKDFNVKVTYDNLADSKKMATTLNKLSTKINDLKKEKLKSVEEPINIFKSQIQELIDICQEGRSKILDQVKVFEDEKREVCKMLLLDKLDKKYNDLNVEKEFQDVKIDDLILMSNVEEFDGVMRLKTLVQDKVSDMVYKSLSMQQKTQMRLVELENLSLKAGLKSPLERRHVESFLKTDDEVYKSQLNKLFENEIRRQNEIEERIKAEQKKEQEKRETQIRLEEENKHKAELDRIQKEQAEKQRLESETRAKENETNASLSEILTNLVSKESLHADSSMDTFIVTATFKVQIESSKMATVEAVKSKFTKTFQIKALLQFKILKYNKYKLLTL